MALCLRLLVVTKGLNWKGSWSWANCNLCGFHSQKIINRSTRIRQTDLFSLRKPLIFSAGLGFHLRSESTVLGRKLEIKCSTFNRRNFWPFTNWILCGFLLSKTPKFTEINHLWLNTFQRRSSETLAKHEPFSLQHCFLFTPNLTAILVFPRLFSAFFWKLKACV